MSWLLALAGPLVWITHFLLVYAGQGVACAGPRPFAATLLVGIAGIVALATLVALLIAQRRMAASPARAIALPLTALSILGVGWVSLPALIVPACL